MNTVYKKNGKALEVNDHALKYLDALGLTLNKPALSRKPIKKVKKA